MGATELFKLSARLVLDSEEFDNGVDKAVKKGENLSGMFRGAESGVTKLSSAMNVASRVGSGITGLVKSIATAGFDLASTAADMEAMGQSYSETFRGMEDEATAAFARVSQANNIAGLRLQETGIAFFRQFTSAGMDEADALLAMEQALGHAADAAAAYNISLEDASSMIRSFVRGNVEAGESVGLFVNQTTRENLADTLFDGKKWEDLNEQQRQFALLTHVNSSYNMSRVFGQGAREMNNWQNVLGNLSSAWNEAQAIMGEEIMIALIPALKDLTAWIEDNPEIFKSLGEIFGEIAESGVEAFKELLAFVNNNKDSILSFLDGITRIFKGFDPAPKRETAINAKSRQAAIDYLTGEGTYRDMLNAFGGKTSENEGFFNTLASKFNDTDEEISADVAAEFVDNALADLQKDLDAAKLTAEVEIHTTGLDPLLSAASQGLSNFTNWLWGDRPEEGQTALYNAKGLEYVPYDDYLTRLHRGESVLNRVEAADWRSAQRGGGYGADPAAIGEAVKAALAGVTINMDGRSVGTMVTPYVSREQAAEYWRKR